MTFILRPIPAFAFVWRSENPRFRNPVNLPESSRNHLVVWQVLQNFAAHGNVKKFVWVRQLVAAALAKFSLPALLLQQLARDRRRVQGVRRFQENRLKRSAADRQNFLFSLAELFCDANSHLRAHVCLVIFVALQIPLHAVCLLRNVLFCQFHVPFSIFFFFASSIALQ